MPHNPHCYDCQLAQFGVCAVHLTLADDRGQSVSRSAAAVLDRYVGVDFQGAFDARVAAPCGHPHCDRLWCHLAYAGVAPVEESAASLRQRVARLQAELEREHARAKAASAPPPALESALRDFARAFDASMGRLPEMAGAAAELRSFLLGVLR
jgi:uncharacterized small protein (DUF1192 family)